MWAFGLHCLLLFDEGKMKGWAAHGEKGGGPAREFGRRIAAEEVRASWDTARVGEWARAHAKSAVNQIAEALVEQGVDGARLLSFGSYSTAKRVKDELFGDAEFCARHRAPEEDDDPGEGALRLREDRGRAIPDAGGGEGGDAGVPGGGG